MASWSNDMKKKDSDIWLVGETLAEITGSELPSNRQVFQRFFHLHKVESQTISASAAATTKEVIQFWDKARIPTRKNHHINTKIKDLHSTWTGIKKNARRISDTQREKERQFTERLSYLFDIAHADSLTMIKKPEDRQFLLAQREKGRCDSLGPVDMVLARKEGRHRKRKLYTVRSRAKEANHTKQTVDSLKLSSSNKSAPEISCDPRNDSISRRSKRVKVDRVKV